MAGSINIHNTIEKYKNLNNSANNEAFSTNFFLFRSSQLALVDEHHAHAQYATAHAQFMKT